MPHRPSLNLSHPEAWSQRQRERFEERAAILEFMALMPRHEAEIEAAYLAWWHDECPPNGYAIPVEIWQAWNRDQGCVSYPRPVTYGSPTQATNPPQNQPPT